MLCSHERESPGVNILQLGDRLKNQNACEGHTARSQAQSQMTLQGTETEYVNSQKTGLRGKKKKERKGWREGRAGREKTEGGRGKGEEEGRREGGNI